MTTANAPQYARKAKQTNYWVRNGDLYVPDATFHTFLDEEANHVCRWRGKSWSFFTPLPSIPAAASGARNRWRFAFHSSTHARYLWCHFVSLPGSGYNDPYVKFSLETSVIPGTVACTGEFHSSEPGKFATLTTLLESYVVGNDGAQAFEITPDTDYYVYVSDVDGGRLASCAFYEECMDADTDNGYLAGGYVVGAPIFDTDRGGIVPLARNAWKRNAAPVLNWASTTDAASPTRSSAAIANLVTSALAGAPTTATPGVTLANAHKSTYRRGTNIPCVMKVFGKCAGGGAGHVYLTTSAGVDVADVEIDNTTEQWFSAAFDLPTTDGKYDLRFNSDGVNLLTVRAVSVYPYE